MKSHDEVVASILVESGYADDINKDHTAHAHPCGRNGDDIDWEFRLIEPYADTLEGRRQADAIEDWLDGGCLWNLSKDKVEQYSNHQWRLDRIRWCIEQLQEEK